MAESTATAVDRSPLNQPELKRVMGPKLLLLFIVGDILGTGIYAVTGNVANQVGGVVWLPFLVAFIVATMTAFSYLELVTKYPQAAGAALYTHKAFGLHFVTFLVCFTVMASGITSASTASRAFAANLAAFAAVLRGGDAAADPSPGLILLLALLFMALVAAVNLRGVAESVKANIVLTLVELSGLLIVIFVGLFAVTQGKADFSRIVIFDTPEDKSIFVAVTAGTSLAFFAMVGFEDSVNMAEEVKEPERVFPKIMLTGLGITGAIYILVSITAIALVPGRRARRRRGPVDQGGRRRGPEHPDRRHLPADRHVRGGQLGPDQHDDGQPTAVRDGQAAGAAAGPRPGAGGTAYAVGGDPVHHRDRGRPAALRRLAGERRQCDQPARRHHRAAAAGRVHRGQHLLPGAAAGLGQPRALPGADRAADHRRRLLRLPGHAALAAGTRSST